jgi:hypothetical protein
MRIGLFTCRMHAIELQRVLESSKAALLTSFNDGAFVSNELCQSVKRARNSSYVSYFQISS